MKSFLVVVVVKRFGTERFYRSAVRRQVLGTKTLETRAAAESAGAERGSKRVFTLSHACVPVI